MTEVPVGEGEILLGKYRVERVLGRGGMGVVVAARHLELGELFAIKFLLPQALGNAGAVERFVREARASARLKGVHVAKVYDVGRMDGGAPYMVMEHLSGGDLSQLLRARGALPVDDVLTYVSQACEAVAEAHSLGIVHRDLKPANMFLIQLPNGAPCVKVLDFGISKQMEVSHGLTQTGTLLGSPLYMPPEQITGRPVDPRSDIWALGVVLFELLTAKYPLYGTALPELIFKIVQDTPPPPSQLRPGIIPPELDALVLRCMEKSPDRRFQTVADLLQALRSLGAPQRFLVDSASIAAAAAMAGQSPAHPTGVGSLTGGAAPGQPPAQGSISGQLMAQSASGAEASAQTSAGAVSRVAAPAGGRSSAAGILVGALIAGAAIGGTAFFMTKRGSPVPPPAAPSAAAPSAAAPEPTASAAKVKKAKKWWDELPVTKADQPTPAAAAALPAPKLKWLQLRNRAAELEEAQKHEEARAALLQALDAARKLGPEDAAFPDTLMKLAEVAAKLGKLEDVEKFLKEAVQVLDKYGDPAEEGFDEARHALIAVLVKEGKAEEAAQEKALLKNDAEPAASASAAAPVEPPASASASAAPTPTVSAALKGRLPPPKPKSDNPFDVWDHYKDKEKRK